MPILKRLTIYIFVLGILIGLAPYGEAQDVQVQAEVSSTKVALGSAVQLTVTIHGGKDVEPVQLPKIEGFDVQYLGPSTRVSIVNGQYSSSKTFSYSLFPLKEGQFQIPAFNIMVSGKTYTTQPVTIEVGGSQGQTSPSMQSQPVSLKDKIFLSLQVSKNEVYLNEPLAIKIFFRVTGFSVSDIQYPELNNVGFTMGGYETPRQYQEIVDGIRYDIVEFNTEIYPTRSGALRLGPAKTSCNVLVRNSSQQSRFGGRGSMFDDDFFNSFFNQHEKRPIVLESEDMTVNVLELPQEGKPEGFSGAVGQFDFNVSVGPTEVKEGDPITLRMTVLGKGNLAAIQMPSLPSEANFKLYDPQIFEKEGIKKTEQVIIPQSEQITEVPVISFSYFNPQSRSYQTIKKGPFSIKVMKLEKGEEFKVVGLEGDVRTIEPEILGQDIIFIKSRPGNLRIAGQHVYNSVLFYVFILMGGALWLGGYVYYMRTRRIKTDIVYARRLQAPKQAKQGLAQAKRLIAANKKEEFYDAVFKTIQQYLGNKLHLSSGAVTFETVQTHLGTQNVDQKIIEDIRITFEECDMIRYASADINREKMNGSYQRLAHLIDHLERFLK